MSVRTHKLWQDNGWPMAAGNPAWEVGFSTWEEKNPTCVVENPTWEEEFSAWEGGKRMGVEERDEKANGKGKGEVCLPRKREDKGIALACLSWRKSRKKKQEEKIYFLLFCLFISEYPLLGIGSRVFLKWKTFLISQNLISLKTR